MSECAKWLQEYLHGGPCEVSYTKEAAKKNGFSKAELKAARKELGVKTWHQPDYDGPVTGMSENWFWYLPGDRP